MDKIKLKSALAGLWPERSFQSHRVRSCEPVGGRRDQCDPLDAAPQLPAAERWVFPEPFSEGKEATGPLHSRK